MPRRLCFTLAAVSLAVAAPASAQGATLFGTVGPDDTIILKNAAGAKVTKIKAGTHTIVVTDKADDHNFHLSGSGVNKATGVKFKGKVPWKVKLAKGKTYRYVCDPHAGSMKGSFKAV